MSVDELARRIFAATPEPTPEQRRKVRARFAARGGGSPAPRTPRVRSRVIGGALTAGGIAAIGVLLFGALPRGGDDAPSPAGGAVLPIFGTPQTAADRLPAPVLDRMDPDGSGLDLASVRLARVTGGRRFYVALMRAGQPGVIRTHDLLCLIDLRTGDTRRGTRLIGGWNCQELSEGRRFIIASEIPAGQRDMTVFLNPRSRGGLVAGLIPPGYRDVTIGTTTVRPVNGVFLIQTDDLSRPIVTDGPQGTIKLGLGVTPEPTWKHGRGRILELGIFTRAATPKDTLPARTRRALERSRSWNDLLLDRARFAGTSPDGRRFWLVPRSREKDRIAIARVSRRGSLSSTGMLLPRDDAPLILDWRPAYRGPFRNANVFVTGLVADGYTRARIGGKMAAIRDNFFVIRDVVGVGYITVTIDGPAGSYTANVNAGFPQARTPFVLKP
ncbi:MAG: hypothetical protein IT200_07985 [Thermoleophilia bacterium]|nr:hypothetical protein [Thermoleophilia bacterium]